MLQNLAKLGIQQSNNPLSALGSILKRNSTGRGSLPRKSSKKLFDSPQSSPKTKKKSSANSSPIGMRYGSEPPEGKTPKSGGLFKGLRRSGSRSKKKGGDNDDNRSETGSLLSLPIHSTLDEQSEDFSEIKKSPPPVKATLSSSTPKSGASTTHESTNKKERAPPTQVTPQRVPLRDGRTSAGSSANRKTTDSAIFKESDVESLFSSQSGSLFNTSELDKLLGKKKEKTPERTLDDGAAEDAKKRAAAEEEKKKKSSAMKKSVSEYNVRSSGYLGVGGMLPSRVETKKTTADAGRKRSIKEQLHRYESYSSVSKSSDPPVSPVEEVSPTSTSSKQDEVFYMPGSAKTTTILEEEKDQSKEAIKEEEEEEVSKNQDEATKLPEVSSGELTITISDTSKHNDDTPSEKEPSDKEPAKEPLEKISDKDLKKESTNKSKGAGLFADVSDDDDLFKKPSVSKKEEQKATKTAALFSDDDDDVVSKKSSEVKADPVAVSADVKKEAEKADTVDVAAKGSLTKDKAGESEDDSLFSTSASSKSKSSSLFDDNDFEDPPRYNIRNRSRGKPSKDSQLEKDDSEVTLKKPLKVDSESDSLFSTSNSSKEKSSSLFDDVDFEDPPRYNIRIRSRGKAGKDSQPEEDDESLFNGSKSKLKSSATEETSKKEEVAKTEPVAEPPSVTESVPDATSASKLDEPSQINLEEDNTDKSTPHNLSSKANKTEKVAPEKPTKVAPKPSRKPVIPKEASSPKPGTGGDTKPSWMAELKKRKQEKEGEAPSSAQKKDSEVPEWKKRALEREKKKEAGKSVLNTKKDVQKSPSAGRRSPLSERKADVEKSPRANRREKLTNGDTPDEKGETKTKKEADSSTTSLSPDHSSTSSPMKYKTRREREREAKEKEEKEQSGNVNVTETASRTQEEVGTKKEEPVAASEVKSSYKTRRQREKEAQELEKQQEAKKDKTDDENKKTISEKDSTKSVKEEPAEERPRYKTRRQREREAREKEEKEAREKEAKEKEEKEASKSENVKMNSPYKTRRQREKEAKEKERELAKEKAEETDSKIKQQEKEKETKKEEDNLKASSSSNSLSDGSSRPPLKKKPSIEIVSRKIRSGSKSSDIGGDDLKSPTIKISSSDSKTADKKENSEMDDDVFATDPVRSPSHKEAPRTSSPRLIVEKVDADSSTKVKHDSEASNDPLDVKIEDFEKSHLASPQNRSGASTPKSSVSSERDINEVRPFRSHTISSSRSPTPPGTGPLKLSDQVPEWKRKLMEKKRATGSSPVHKPATMKAEQSDDKLPPWKRELLAKKKTRGDGKVGLHLWICTNLYQRIVIPELTKDFHFFLFLFLG